MEKKRKINPKSDKNFFLKHKESLFLIIILSFFSFVCLYKLGSVSTTIDEHNDLWITRCYLNNPFHDCEGLGANQGRIPFYIHAMAEYLFSSPTSLTIHYLVSFIFGLGIILIIYFFLKKEFNTRLAQISILLISTSIPILTSARMLLHHSNIIMAFFNILSIITFYYFIKHNNLGNTRKSIIFLILTLITFLLAISSGFLNILLLVFFLSFYSLNLKKERLHRNQLYALIFITSILIILSIEYFHLKWIFSAISQYLSYQAFPIYWNYLNTGSNLAPRWFSFLIFLIKVTPWWSFFFIAFIFVIIKERNEIRRNIKKSFLLSAFVYILFYLTISSGFFRYDVPHHQVIFYPLAYIIIAYSVLFIYKAIKSITLKNFYLVLLVLLVILQIFQIYQFFPNYLFYGSQYGKSLVGEFYGPAELHCQDTNTINQKIDSLSKQNASILFPHFVCGSIYKPENATTFNQENFSNQYDYAFWDYLYGEHLKYLVTPRYKEYLDSQCSIYYEYKFPKNFTVYAIYKCKNT